jgi:hypothetical protein
MTTRGTDFNKRYLGPSVSDPSYDNNGLIIGSSNIGALYFNTTENVLKVWSGTTWNYTTVNQSIIDNIFSQLANVVHTDTNTQGLNNAQKQNAYTNLSLGTAALANLSALATAAQGAKADTAVQSADLTTFKATLGALATKDKIVVGDINTASGTPGASTYLAGDNTWKASSTADMKASIYDPTGIGKDAFARANFTGTQAIATIDLLQTTLDAKLPSANIVGAVVYTTGNTALPGTVKLNGSALSRASYSRLWAFAQSSGNIVNDNVWTAGQYSVGDGSTTFRIPDYRGLFIRSFDDGKGTYDPSRVLASLQGSANLSHAHGVNDPGHAHGASSDAQGQHTHGIGDPGHSHGIPAGGGSTGGNSNFPNNVGNTNTGYTYGAGTGIYTGAAGNHAHNISIAGAYTGISIAASGGSESRPVNVAAIACVYY